MTSLTPNSSVWTTIALSSTISPSNRSTTSRMARSQFSAKDLADFYEMELGSCDHHDRLLLLIDHLTIRSGTRRCLGPQPSLSRPGRGSGHFPVSLRRSHRQRRLCLAVDPGSPPIGRAQRHPDEPGPHRPAQGLSGAAGPGAAHWSSSLPPGATFPLPC